MKRRVLHLAALMAALILLFAGCSGSIPGQSSVDTENVESSDDSGTADPESDQAAWEEAAHTPLGKYPETVEYTLGKISGANNSNLPAGDTYEDNAYTRYLKEVLNIQNVDIFELEAGGSYEEAL